MKREIKFRQPIFERGKFTKWHYWGFLRGGFVGPITDRPDLDEAEDKSQQYTGLHDKNGKEIYEGDIVRQYFSAPWDEEIPISINGVIAFGDPFDGCFCFIDNKADNTCCLYEIGNENGCGTTIGNIYENPEHKV